MKGKTRAERRRDTYFKIKERLRKLISFGSYCVTKNSTVESIISGKESGRLRNGAEDNYGKGGRAIKTNTRKGHASYRHKGAYGPENNYSAHDERQIDSLNQSLNEYKEDVSEVE